jgi:hypothetical protein
LLWGIGYKASEAWGFSLGSVIREGHVSVKKIKWYIEFLLDDWVRDHEDPNCEALLLGEIQGLLFVLGYGKYDAVAKRVELIENGGEF